MSERLYDYTLERETGDASNFYWGNVNKRLTLTELEEAYNSEGNGQLRKAFGSFDNYLSYMNERQDLIDAGDLKADWWNTGQPLVTEDQLASKQVDDRTQEGMLIQAGVQQGEIGYNAQAEVQEALYQKYTGEQGNVHYNSDGDTFRWNGSSYVKTAKVDDHNYGAMVPGLVVGGVLGAGLGPALANWGLTGTLNAAASGALGNAVSQGMLTGSIDPKEVLYSGLTSGALSGFADYLSDSANMFPDSDLGGMLGDGGFLNKLGFDTDYLSTSAGISALDWAANNPVISGAQQLLAPILNSTIGQGGLDLLTSAVMDGYNDEWREHYDPETGGLDVNATAEDFKNFNRYNSAIAAGKNALTTGQSLDGSPIWNLDERYFWTTTPRDPNSTLVGILDQPLESEGGMEAYIAFLNAANEADKDSKETGEGEDVSGSGSSTGNGEGLEGESDKGESKGDGMLPELTGGGSGTSGNASGSGAGMDAGGSLPVTGNADQVVINQLIEAIDNATDPDVKAGLEEALDSYLSSSTDSGSDVVIENGNDDTALPPADTNVLPPEDSGGDGGSDGGLFAPANGDGLPPLWTELFGYTKISPYKKARLKVLEGMLGGMMGGGVGNFNDLQFGANKDPYQRIGRSLYEAGIKE
jgi:hypothetical protein